MDLKLSFFRFEKSTQIHAIANRALPDQILNYKHAIIMYKLFNHCQPETEFIQMNFQLNQNQRLSHANFYTSVKITPILQR